MFFIKKQIPHLTFALIFTISLLISFVNPASANGIITDGEIKSNEKIENDVIVFSDQVLIEGTVDGDLFALGGEVIVNGDVTGSLITIGRDITIDGQVGGSTYAAGVNLNLGPSSKIDRNVYFAGIRLSTVDGMKIGRDLVVAALTGQLAGQVGRDFKATIGLLQFIDIIREGVEEEITPESAPTPGAEPDTEGLESGNAFFYSFNSGNYKLISLNAKNNNHLINFETNSPSNDLKVKLFQQLDPSNIENEVLFEWIVI